MKLKDIRVTCQDYPGITFTILTLSNDVACIHPVNEYWCTWVNVNTLELVTPVEELEPFEVYHRPSEWCVIKKANNLIVSIYNVGIHHNPKAAAEAECARLNAEFRKGMEK